jgi:hypothetical protein
MPNGKRCEQNHHFVLDTRWRHGSQARRQFGRNLNESHLDALAPTPNGPGQLGFLLRLRLRFHKGEE